MPNNHIIIGDIDSKMLEKEKLSAAEEGLQHINHIIEQRKTGEFMVVKGFLPWLLTGLLNPMLQKKGH
ncbi:hypothetical protein [Thermotalea metallivorans]|nr:hypothetical protein [Thermotalea metallivorans]